MENIVSDLVAWAVGPGWIWRMWFPAWVLLFVASPWGLRLAGNPGDRKFWVGVLMQDRGKRLYRREMTRVLKWVDTRLSGPECAAGESEAAKAWSGDLLQLTLFLAAAYPALSILLQWLAGSPLRFGGSELAAPGSASTRLFTGLWLGGFLFLNVFSAKLKFRWRPPLFITATGILALGLFFAERIEVPAFVAGAIAGAFAVAGTVAGTVAGAFAGALAVAFAGAFAGALAVAGAVLAEHARNKFGGVLPWLIWIALLLTAIFAVTHWAWRSDDAAVSAYLMIFLGLFPILNALADFASVGLTRYLLRAA